jgi:simple sugar transport system ATP-binding protein
MSVPGNSGTIWESGVFVGTNSPTALRFHSFHARLFAERLPSGFQSTATRIEHWPLILDHSAMLELQHISKSFAGNPALMDVSLTIQPHEIHGLLGENGAGKSTLMNILFGLLQPDAGVITLQNKPVKITSPRIAGSLGIGMVHQHFKLVPTLTTLENLALASHTPVRKIRPRATALAQQLQWQIPLSAKIESLSVGEQQRIEILKALLTIQTSAQNAVLILDEPTAVLTPTETAELFAALKTLVAEQHTSIIFISHKLNEVQKVCDTLTILRRGKHILTAPTKDLTPKEMTTHMVGAPVELPHRVASGGGSPHHRGDASPLLQLENLHSGQLKNINLAVEPGTITGIAGVDGNGQSDLAAAIVGAQPITAGTLKILGKNATSLSIKDRLESLAYIPEDRHRQALVLEMNVTQNLLLKDYRRRPYSTAGWLHFATWRAHAQRLIQQFDIRANSPLEPAARLSGGNQQKIVLARELHNPDKKIVLALNPTRGLDVGATAFVMNQLLEARVNGAAVLLIHSDLDELLAISDTIHVLFNGSLTHAPNPTKDSIAPLMLGLASTS